MYCVNLRADFLIFSISLETYLLLKNIYLWQVELPFRDDDYITLLPIVAAFGVGLGEGWGGRLGLADVSFYV